MSRGVGGRGCFDQVPCPCPGGGGVLTRSHVHVRGEGGVVTRSHVHVRGVGGVVTRSHVQGGGGCDQVPCPCLGGGGVVQRHLVLQHLPPPGLGQTDACENITFARFAKRAVNINQKANFANFVYYRKTRVSTG